MPRRWRRSGKAVTLAQPGHLIRLFPEMGGRVRPLLAALRLRGRSDAFLDELIASFTVEATPFRRHSRSLSADSRPGILDRYAC